MKIIRIVLGYLLIAFEKLFSPKIKKNSPQEGARINAALSGLSIYEFRTCPFCMKVRFAMRRLGIEVPLKDAQRDAQGREELLKGGGKIQVPCLRMQSTDGSVNWMYESNDIISYLESVCKKAI